MCVSTQLHNPTHQLIFTKSSATIHTKCDDSIISNKTDLDTEESEGPGERQELLQGHMEWIHQETCQHPEYLSLRLANERSM